VCLNENLVFINGRWKLGGDFARTRRAIILAVQRVARCHGSKPPLKETTRSPRFYVPQNRFHPGSYFACNQTALEYLGIGVSQQRQMRDREEQQQKAQPHRISSARRSCDERSSAHNYRDRYGRALSAAKRSL